MEIKIIWAFVIYVAILSIYAVIITIIDKKSAISGGLRISEKHLFTTALLGGSAAMLFTMKKIRHKTLHKRFMIGLPMIIVLHIAIIGAAVYFFIIK